MSRDFRFLGLRRFRLLGRLDFRILGLLDFRILGLRHGDDCTQTSSQMQATSSQGKRPLKASDLKESDQCNLDA